MIDRGEIKAEQLSHGFYYVAYILLLFRDVIRERLADQAGSRLYTVG